MAILRRRIGPAAALLLLAWAMDASALECGRTERISIPPGGTWRVPDFAGDTPIQAVEIRELGRELLVRTASATADAAVGSRPPRLGIEVVERVSGFPLLLRSATPYGDATQVELTAVCGGQVPAALAACVARARSIDAGNSPPEPPAQSAEPICTALIRHASGSWYSRKGLSEESIHAYDAAIAAWKASGDAARQGAAWLGRAEQLNRLARYAEAIESARTAERLSVDVGIDYFAARAVMERCGNLQALGRRAESVDCQRGLAQRFASLGEFNDVVNVRANEARMALEVGSVADAQAALDAIPKDGLSGISEMNAGRLALAKASLEVGRGRFDLAISQIETALSRFESIPDRRWVANAQLTGASILFALEARADAAALATLAERSFAELKAPARQAAAQRVLAEIAKADGKSIEAVQWATRAAEQFRRTQRPWPALDADLIAVALGDDAAAERAAHALAQDAIPPALAVKAQLAFATRDLLRRNWDDARRRSAQLDDSVLDPDQTIRRRILDARLAINAGQPRYAMDAMDAAIADLHRLGAHLPGAALRLSLGLRLLDLQAVWVDAYVATPLAQRPGPDVVWRMMLHTRPEVMLGLAQATGGFDADALARFQWATARALVPRDDLDAADTEAPRALLAYQGRLGPARSAPGTQWPALDAARARLSPGDAVLAFGRGSEQLLRLLARADDVSVDIVAFDEATRGRLQGVVEAIKQPTTALAELAVTTRDLSRTLLGGIAAPRPPRLFVLADFLRASGVLPLLEWPGDSAPLIEATELTWLALPPTRGDAGDAPRAVKVFVAASTSGAGAGPGAAPALATATAEPEWIRQALPGRALQTFDGPVFTDAALRSALAETGSWVHVAAHGRTIGTRLGQSGLVLDAATPGGAPGFVSWMSLVDRPIAAELVILNACDLAAAPEWQASGRAVFATAIAAAGTRHTIAALWAVSDRASSVWVPALYGALGADSASPAAALAQAQRALRATRMHRHPYYWASLVHFGPLP